MIELVDNLRKNFLDRVCTILTQPVSFPFKDAIQHSQFFTGKVVDVNQYGIWLKHLQIGTYAFYSFPIVGIVEEQYVPENDPRIDKIRQELKKKEMPKASQFIPVESLTKIVRDSKG